MTRREEGDDPAAVRRRLRRCGATTQQRELERALARMEAEGSLAPEQRDAVRRLAAAVVARVLAGPSTTLAAAATDGRGGEAATGGRTEPGSESEGEARTGDQAEQLARVAAELFDLE